MSLEKILENSGKQIEKSYEILQDYLLALKDKNIEDIYKTPKDLEKTIGEGNYMASLEIAGMYAMQGNLELFKYFVDTSMQSFMQYFSKNEGKISQEDMNYMNAISLLAINIGSSYEYIRQQNGLETSNFEYDMAA